MMQSFMDSIKIFVRYKKKAIEVGRLLKDESASSLEKAIWWIEYVIKNKGAPYFRSRVVDLPWYEFLLVDVYVFLFLVGVAVCYVAYRLIRYIVSLLSLLGTNKMKSL